MFLEQKLVSLSVIAVILALIVIGLVIYVFFQVYKKEKNNIPKDYAKKTSVIPKLTEDEKRKIKESNKKKRLLLLSKLGIDKSKEIHVESSSQGVLACGIVFDNKSNVYFFSPKDQELKPGDVVYVTDINGKRRLVPIVLGNSFIDENEIIKPFREIEEVVYVYQSEDLVEDKSDNEGIDSNNAE